MISLELIYDFLMIGFLSFGGGYTTIPMVKDLVDKYEVLNMEMLENFIAISESTPGPIAINLATFVGNEVSGIIGGLLATLFEILPAFFIILIFVAFFKKYIGNENVKFALSIIRPCIVGIIMTVGVVLFVGGFKPYIDSYIPLYKNIKHRIHIFNVSDMTNPQAYLDEIKKLRLEANVYLVYIVKYLIIAVLVVLAIILSEKVFKKKLSSIKIIIFGAILGIAINYIL